MAANKHQPAADAPAEVWIPHLKGLGYTPATEPKPVSNYRDFHGYWVPPRLGSAKVAPAPKTKRRRKLEFGVDPAWFDMNVLAALHEHHPDVFAALRGRIDDVEAAAERGGPAARIATRRDSLAAAIEAGLINREEAARQLAAWADAEGISLSEG